jgi:hypothetical protein
MATQPRQPIHRSVPRSGEPRVERETDSAQQRLTEQFSAEFDARVEVATDGAEPGGHADTSRAGAASSPLAGRTDSTTGDEAARRLGKRAGAGEEQSAPSTDLEPGDRRQNRATAYEQMTAELTPDIGAELGYGGAGMFAQKSNVVTGNAAAYTVVENKDGEAVKSTTPFSQGVDADASGLMMGGLSHEYVPPPAEAPDRVTKASEDGQIIVTKDKDGTVSVTSGHSNTETTIKPDGSTETRDATTGKLIDTTPPLVTPKDADPEKVDTEGLEEMRALGRVLGIDETHGTGGLGTGDGHTDPADTAAGGIVGDRSVAQVDPVAMFGQPVGGDADLGGRGAAVPATIGSSTDAVDPSEQDAVTGAGAGREDDPLGQDRPSAGGPLSDPGSGAAHDSSGSGYAPISRFDDIEIDLAPASDIMDLDG